MQLRSGYLSDKRSNLFFEPWRHTIGTGDYDPELLWRGFAHCPMWLPFFVSEPANPNSDRRGVESRYAGVGSIAIISRRTAI